MSSNVAKENNNLIDQLNKHQELKKNIKIRNYLEF